MIIVFIYYSIEQTSGFESGSYFEKGSHMVSYKVADIKGVESTCSFTFTVEGEYASYASY
jgi:hypothetical protein